MASAVTVKADYSCAFFRKVVRRVTLAAGFWLILILDRRRFTAPLVPPKFCRSWPSPWTYPTSVEFSFCPMVLFG